MREVAERAEIPVGLIYTYYKGKTELMAAIAEPVLNFLTDHMSNSCLFRGINQATYFMETKDMLMTLLNSRKAVIVAMDKSAGTKYENTKELVIDVVRAHIAKERPLIVSDYEEFHSAIIATCFVESVMAIARRYESRDWAERMIIFIADKLFPQEIPRA